MYTHISDAYTGMGQYYVPYVYGPTYAYWAEQYYNVKSTKELKGTKEYHFKLKYTLLCGP